MSECEYDIQQDLDSGLYWDLYGHAFSTSRMGFSSGLDTQLDIEKEGRGADQLWSWGDTCADLGSPLPPPRPAPPTNQPTSQPINRNFGDLFSQHQARTERERGALLRFVRLAGEFTLLCNRPEATTIARDLAVMTWV